MVQKAALRSPWEWAAESRFGSAAEEAAQVWERNMLFSGVPASLRGGAWDRLGLEDLLAAAGTVTGLLRVVKSARLQLPGLDIVLLKHVDDMEQTLAAPVVQHRAGDFHPPLGVAGHEVGGGDV